MLPVPNNQHPGRPLQAPKEPRKDSGVVLKVVTDILRTVHHTSFFRLVMAPFTPYPASCPALKPPLWSSFYPPISAFHLISLFQAREWANQCVPERWCGFASFNTHELSEAGGQLSRWWVINLESPRRSSSVPSVFLGNTFHWGTSMQDPAFCPPWSLPSNTVVLLTLGLRQQVKQGKPDWTDSTTQWGGSSSLSPHPPQPPFPK